MRVLGSTKVLAACSQCTLDYWSFTIYSRVSRGPSWFDTGILHRVLVLVLCHGLIATPISCRYCGMYAGILSRDRFKRFPYSVTDFPSSCSGFLTGLDKAIITFPKNFALSLKILINISATHVTFDESEVSRRMRIEWINILP